MEAEVEAYYREYKDGVISLLTLSGLWPEDSRQSKHTRFVLSSFTLIIEIMFVYAVGNFAAVHSHNMNALVSSSAVLTSFSCLLAKIVLILLYKEDVLYLNRNLASCYETDLEVVEYRPYLLAYYRAFYRFFKIHFYYFLAFLLVGMPVPVIAAYHGKSARLYPVHPPFHYEPGGTRHWMIFAFEVISGMYAVTVSVGYDTLFGLYTLNIVGEMKLLTHRFRNLKSGKNYRGELKECVDRHVVLMDSKNIMQRLFGFSSVMLAVTCALIICSQIFTLTTNKNLSTFKIVFLIDYVLAKFFQAYMYAWFGNCLTVESEICLNAIYDAKWAGSNDLRLMNDILIIQSQSPLYFETCGIMKVCLDMFVKIVNTSISYFFMLKTIEEKLTNQT